MSFEVGTADSSCYLYRTTGLNYNAAYTVLFYYYSTGSHSGDFLWGLTGSTSGSSSNPGYYRDQLRFIGGGNLWLDIFGPTAPGYQSKDGPTLSTGWHKIAVVRSSATAIRFLVDGTEYANASYDVSTREAVNTEWMLNDIDSGGEVVPVGSRVTNYKSWSSALSNAEVDAEFAATAFTITANKYSGSPMGDAATVAGNNTADGSGTAWTYGASVTYGANNPGVTYGGSTYALQGSGILTPSFIGFNPGFGR